MVRRRTRIGCWSAVGVLLLIVSACLVSMYREPPTWRVARTRTIAAAAPRVREQLVDLHRYIACCGTPEAQSTTASTRFSTASEGPGAWAEWNAPAGVERITIASVSEDRIVMHYVVAGIGTEQTIQWRAIGERTEVTWVIDGNKSGFLQRLVWPVAQVEPGVSDAIDTSLGGLERAAR